MENLSAIVGGNVNKIKRSNGLYKDVCSKVGKISYITSYNTNDNETRNLARNGMFKLDYEMKS